VRRRGLRIGGHVDRYVGTLFLSSYATAFLLVVGLFLVLDMAGNIDEYVEPWPDGSRAPASLIASYYVLQVPFVFLQIGPFVTLVAGLFTVSKLVKFNETVAVLAAGVSAQRLLAPLFVAAVACGGVMFGLRELVTFEIANKRDAIKYVLDNKSHDRVYRNLWLRDLNGSVVRLAQFRPSYGDPPVAEVRGLEAIVRSTKEYKRIEADRATYVELPSGRLGWRLEGVRRVAGSETREHGLEQSFEMLEGFEFTPALALTFHRAHEHPLELSFREARDLGRRDPDNVVYQTLLQYFLTFPLANLVLLLVGLPVLMRHERGKGAEGLAAGSLLCVFYFCADFVFRDLGLRGSLDPLFSAWTPILFFGILGLALVDGMRT
jgi:lipopolysaccharide export system permease protein